MEFEDFLLSEIKHWSISRINLYLSCPFAYYLRYVEKWHPRVKPLSIIVGGIIHSTLEKYFKNEISEKELAQDSLQELAKFRLTCEKSEFSYYWKRIPTLMMAFQEANLIDREKVLEIEKEHFVPIINFQTGEKLENEIFWTRLDLLHEGSKGLIITDFKTGKKAPQGMISKEELKEIEKGKKDEVLNDLLLQDPQLHGYSYALHFQKKRVRAVQQVHLIFSTQPKVGLIRVPLHSARIKRFSSWLFDVVSHIKSDTRFPRYVSWKCRMCLFYKLCIKSEEEDFERG